MSDILDEPIRKRPKSDYLKKRYRPILVIGPVILLALLFQTMHWPGVSLFMIIGLSALAGHSIAIVVYLNRNDVITNIGAILLPIAIAFRISVRYNMNGAVVAGIVALISLVLCLLYFREKKH